MYSYLSSYNLYKDDIKYSKCVTYNTRTRVIQFSGSIPSFLYDGDYFCGSNEEIEEQLRKKFPDKHVKIVSQ